MSAGEQRDAAASPAAPGATARRQERRARLIARARALRQAYLQVFGIPDYEAYQAHMAARHPGARLLSHRAFFAQAIERKYGRKGMRCC